MGPLRNRTNASTQGVPPQLNGPPDERGIRFIEMEFLKRDLQTIQRSPSLAPERCGLWDVSTVPMTFGRRAPGAFGQTFGVWGVACVLDAFYVATVSFFWLL